MRISSPKIIYILIALLLLGLLQYKWYRSTEGTSEQITRTGADALTAQALFLRYRYLAGEGEFRELPELGQMVARLAPDYPELVNFIGWDLAWNIAPEFNEPDKRWQWVRLGIRHWTDYALVYGQSEGPYYEDLIRTWLYKVGEVSDGHERYFKWALAVEMDLLIGNYSAQQLFELAQSSPSIDSLDQSIRNQFLISGWYGITEQESTLKNQLALLVQQQLKQRFGLDLETMAEVERVYPFVNWRICQSQALYWYQKSLQFSLKGGKERALKALAVLAAVRSFQEGTLLEFSTPNEFIAVPDLATFPTLKRWLEEEMKDLSTLRNFNLWRGFLVEAVVWGELMEDPSVSKEAYILLERLVKEKEVIPERSVLVRQTLQRTVQSGDYRLVIRTLMALLSRASQLQREQEFAAANQITHTSFLLWRDFQQMVKENRGRSTGLRQLPDFQKLIERFKHHSFQGGSASLQKMSKETLH